MNKSWWLEHNCSECVDGDAACDYRENAVEVSRACSMIIFKDGRLHHSAPTTKGVKDE